MSKAPAAKLDYAAAEREIMDRLDVAAEAKAAGIVFAGDASATPASGWASCHAIGRDDDTPSACICLDITSKSYGAYKDHAGGGTATRFFEWIAPLLGLDSFRAARKKYAEQTGVALPTKKGKPKEKAWPDDKIKVKGDETAWHVMASLWAVRKPPIDGETAVRAGAKYCQAWGKYACIAFPAYMPPDFSTPKSAILYHRDGQDFAAYKSADGKALAKRKTHVCGQDGLVIVGTADDLQSAGSIVKTEGVPDALAIAPHLPPGWIAVANICGASSFPPRLAAAFAGKRLFVAGDADKAGADGSWKVAAASIDVASEVRRIELPYPVTENKGKDLRDFVAEYGAAGVMELIAAAEATGPLTADDIPAEIAAAVARDKARAAKQLAAATDDRPTINVTTDEHIVNDAAIAALTKDSIVFHRGGQLVRVVTADGKPTAGVARPVGAPKIGTLPLPTLRERLSASAKFRKWFGSGDDGYYKDVHVPDFTAKAVASRGEWPGLRGLVAVVDSPTLRPDGTILDEPGWDEATGLLYRPNAEFPAIQPQPTIDDARQARDELLAVVSDFPFAGNEHKAAWLAFLLTPPARHAFDGPAPLFLIDANAPGSGKSLLCDLVSLIFTGRAMPRMANPADDAEASKLITSLAMAGDQLVMVDNVSGSFGCPSIDAALTSTVWKGRILSKNETAELPLAATWCASGNNVSLVGDIGRRICHVRLESDLANPEERREFSHPDVKSWVASERPRLIAAALTILRAYCAAGRPDQRLTPWGSFEGWSGLVRQAVAWVGMVDPGATRQGLAKQSDGEASILRQLLAGWQELQKKKEADGLKAAAVLRELESSESEWREQRPPRSPPDAPPYDLLRTAINELCYVAAGKSINSRSLGNKLRRLKGRRAKHDDGSVIYLDCKDEHGTALWFVAEKKPEEKKSETKNASGEKNNFGGGTLSAPPPNVENSIPSGSSCSSCSTLVSLEHEKIREREIRDIEIGLERPGKEQLEQPEQPADAEAECVWSA